jgi:hypothetical protein
MIYQILYNYYDCPKIYSLVLTICLTIQRMGKMGEFKSMGRVQKKKNGTRAALISF